MRFSFLLSLLFCLPTVNAQRVIETTLTLVEAEGTNEVEIELNVELLGRSNDTSTLTGTIEAQLRFYPGSSAIDQMTILGTDLDGSDVELAARNVIFGRYDFSITQLGFSALTPDPPGEVEIETGEFEASQYEITANRGLLDGTANATLVGSQDVDFDFSETPFGGSGAGTGTVQVVGERLDGRRLFYTIEAEIPVDIEQAIEDEGLPVAADVAVAGLVKAVGEIVIDLPDFEEWAGRENLSTNREAEFDLSGGVPNYFLFALGFDDESKPGELFELQPEGMALKTQTDLALGEVTLEWSSDLANWTPIPQAAMVSGTSEITLAQSLETPTIVGLDGVHRFFRVSR